MISLRVNGFLTFCFQIEEAEIWKDMGAGSSQESSGHERCAAVECQIRS